MSANRLLPRAIRLLRVERYFKVKVHSLDADRLDAVVGKVVGLNAHLGHTAVVPAGDAELALPSASRPTTS